jgi:asparagine synthase (glutamine-hydrolysing)
MCGISGDINFLRPPAREDMEICLDSLAHRGPDSEGLWNDDSAVFGHRRLAILDVSNQADQPMHSPDARYVIVFNGEIYNFHQLRSELEDKGERFVTRGDTEVLLRLYMREGTSALQKLNGMFAFAIWDRKDKAIFAARDRFGEKPFYYFVRPNNGGLIFASELLALTHHPDVPRRPNLRALGTYLANSYTVGPSTILKDVCRLPAAHWMRMRSGHLEMGCYWDLAACFRDKDRFCNEREAAEELRSLVQDSVKLRLVSDVPLGAFLSGGVDSSIVVSAMAQAASRRGVRSYSIGFTEDGYSELPFARSVAQGLGVSLFEDMVAPELSNDIPRIAQAAAEPFADTSIVPTYYVARHARRHVTVALSGDGGDELFAGYETYVANRLHNQASWCLRPVATLANWATHSLIQTSYGKVSFDYKARQFARGLALPFEQAHWFWRNIFDRDMRTNLVHRDLKEEIQEDGFSQVAKHFAAVEGCHPLDRAIYVDIKTWLVDSVLLKVDRATMAHSLESRAPLLDYRLAEFAARLPPELKLKGFRKKYLLREAFARDFSPGTLDRPKQGFVSPVSHWLAGSLQQLARDVFASVSFTDLFRTTAVEQLYAEHLARRVDHGQRLFNLLMFGLWLTSFRSLSSHSRSRTEKSLWRSPS